MKKEIIKDDGPACACGKGDLYEEWLKNEKNKKEASDTDTSKRSEESNISADSSGKAE